MIMVQILGKYVTIRYLDPRVCEWKIMIIVQALGKYMIIRYLDA